ncbi:class F sortase [Yinghuangia seranimata]|uniref:class F sortase n=1 Tax=Yinghuangia seranimata TaxID=408067 RepID=UPI00248C18BC|nr:class F sortase [Yinghuangia seranimata]MDI2129685.1 class F sortase [Yinghuangia seranimata]
MGIFGLGWKTAVFAAGAALLWTGVHSGQLPPQPAAGSEIDIADGWPKPAPLARAVPTRVEIPSLGVNAPLMSLGVSDSGELEVPPAGKTNLAGWDREAVTPGQVGTAVVVGHVDDERGPSVFYGLGSITRGQTIRIDRADGRTAEFRVYKVEVLDRDDFPAERVYGDRDRAELRLITCGGSFHRGSGYTANVVVFARHTATR